MWELRPPEPPTLNPPSTEPIHYLKLLQKPRYLEAIDITFLVLAKLRTISISIYHQEPPELTFLHYPGLLQKHNKFEAIDTTFLGFP